MKKIHQIISCIKKEWKNGNKPFLLLKLVGIGSLVTCVFMLLIWIATSIITYIVQNLDWIVLTIIIVGTVTAGIKTKLFDSKSNNTPKIDLTEEKQIAEVLKRNYEYLSTILFECISNLHSIIKVKLPTSLEELYSVNRHIRKDNYVVYEYVLRKTGDVPYDHVKTALSQELKRMLEQKRFPGLGDGVHIFDGQAVPIIEIVSVEDYKTSFLIHLVIVDDNYCRSNRTMFQHFLTKGAFSIEANPYDKDF